MCWNATVSLQFFVLGVMAIAVGFVYGGLSVATVFFYASIVCMQLIEYIIWTYGHHATVNFYTSVFAVSLLGIQPIAAMLSFLQKPGWPLLSYTVLAGLYVFANVSTKTPIQLQHDYHIHETSRGHLAWNWLQPTPLTILGLILYFTFLLGPILVSHHWELLGIVLCTLLLSLYSYHKYNTWGSMWCWIVMLLVVVSCGRAIVTANQDLRESYT